jgi:uncharacterized integral membrane protein
MSDDTRQQPTDRSGTIRLIVAAVIIAALVAVAIDNREEVRVGYVVGEASAPVWIVLVAAGIAGIVVGWLIKHRPHRS